MSTVLTVEEASASVFSTVKNVELLGLYPIQRPLILLVTSGAVCSGSANRLEADFPSEGINTTKAKLLCLTIQGVVPIGGSGGCLWPEIHCDDQAGHKTRWQCQVNYSGQCFLPVVPLSVPSISEEGRHRLERSEQLFKEIADGVVYSSFTCSVQITDQSRLYPQRTRDVGPMFG